MSRLASFAQQIMQRRFNILGKLKEKGLFIS